MKKMYVSGRLSRAKNINRELWRCVNDQLGRNSVGNGEIVLLENDVKTSEPGRVSNIFCKFFSTNVAEKIKNSFGSALKECTLMPVNASSMFFEPITCNEIKINILNLKNCHSAGIDGIHAKAVKFVAGALLEPLCIIFNKSVVSGTFPSALKVAKITPVYKNKGNRTDAQSYRPISVLSRCKI